MGLLCLVLRVARGRIAEVRCRPIHAVAGDPDLRGVVGVGNLERSPSGRRRHQPGLCIRQDPKTAQSFPTPVFWLTIEFAMIRYWSRTGGETVVPLACDAGTRNSTV